LRRNRRVSFIEMDFSADKFNEIKNEARGFYNTVGKVWCPYFQEEINFNTKGFDHLIFKKWNKTRVLADQFSRLRHIKLAPEVIRNSKTLQGLWGTLKIERIKQNSRWEKASRNVTYYEFIAIMDSHGSKIRIKIVVKQVEGGEKYFWSLIPFWGIDKTNNQRTMHSGDPEND